MASSAFRSTTKNAARGVSPRIDGSGSSGKPHRRPRSLSRFSHRPEEREFPDGAPARKGMFVNTNRGTLFPDITLEDLSVELFSGKEGTPFEANSATAAAHRRGRSVSRHSSANERRRSLSLARRQLSETESSSSAVTSEGGKDSYSRNYGRERTIRAVYAEKKAENPIEENVNSKLCAALRKELKHAVDEIRMELEHVMVKNSDSAKTKGGGAVAEEVSGMRLLLKEDGELDCDRRNNSTKSSSGTRKRSTDRKKMSGWLNEEAEKYFEDLISDISSFEGERSDSSFSRTKPNADRAAAAAASMSIQLDGVMFPWLRWETTENFASDLPKELMSSDVGCSSSRGSCSSPGDGVCAEERSDNGKSIYSKCSDCRAQSPATEQRRSVYSADDEYISVHSGEKFLQEIFRQRNRIHSGGLLLCDGRIL